MKLIRKYCIKCNTELTDLSNMFNSTPWYLIYCTNKKCSRYGLLTVFYEIKLLKNESNNNKE